MEAAEAELRKNLPDVSSGKLESLLEFAIRASIAGKSDVFNEDVTCFLDKFTLSQRRDAIFGSETNGIKTKNMIASPVLLLSPRSASAPPSSIHMLGVDAFCLDYNITWPLSLVICKTALAKYQLIFRHLFHIKYVERQLCEAWLDHQGTKEFDIRRLFSRFYTLRQRMLHFLQNLAYYMLVEVIEPNWHLLDERLKKVATVDDVLEFHEQFLDQCLRECLLNNQHLLKLLNQLMNTAISFAENVEKLNKDVILRDERSLTLKAREARVKIETDHIGTIVSQEIYTKMIDKFEQSFDDNLLKFVRYLIEKSNTQYDSHLANLLTRLDFNEFYFREIMNVAQTKSNSRSSTVINSSRKSIVL